MDDFTDIMNYGVVSHVEGRVDAFHALDYILNAFVQLLYFLVEFLLFLFGVEGLVDVPVHLVGHLAILQLDWVVHLLAHGRVDVLHVGFIVY